MDKKLLESFSTRLNSICTVEVRIASDSIMLEEMPSVLICSQTCTIERLGHRHKLTHIKPDHATYNPEIDTFFKSMVAYTDRFKILCILLTGIGSDGAIGMLELRKKGALTIAESEESAVVFGMPRSADEMGAASKVLPLDKIIEEILHFDTTAI